MLPTATAASTATPASVKTKRATVVHTDTRELRTHFARGMLAHAQAFSSYQSDRGTRHGMIRHNVSSLLLAGAVILAPMSLGTAHPLDTAYAPEAGVITIQGWPGPPGGPPTGPPGGPPGWSPQQERHEHCWRLRSQAHEIRKHIHYAPPWEQEGLQHQLWQIRQEARGACPGGGRDWG
jgi:hypothetical protein